MMLSLRKVVPLASLMLDTDWVSDLSSPSTGIYKRSMLVLWKGNLLANSCITTHTEDQWEAGRSPGTMSGWPFDSAMAVLKTAGTHKHNYGSGDE